MTLPKLVSLLVFILLIFTVPPAHARQEPSHPVVDPRNVTPSGLFIPLDLSRNWLVQQGDSPAYASPTFDDSRWQVIDTSLPLARYGIDHVDFIWYRLHVHIPPGTHHLALLLRAFVGSEQVYINGLPVGPSRPFVHGGLTTSSTDLLTPIPDQLIATGDIVLAVRAQFKTVSDFGSSLGGFNTRSALFLGEYTGLQSARTLYNFRQFTSNSVNLGLLLLLLLISVAFVVALPSQHEYIALCVFIIAELILNASTIWLAAVDTVPSLATILLTRAANTVGLLAALEFARSVLAVSRTRRLAAYQWLIVATGLLSFAYNLVDFFRPLPAILLFPVITISALVTAPAALGLPFFALWVWRRKGNFDALLLAVPLLVRSAFYYAQIGLALATLLHLRDSPQPPEPPISAFFVGWAELGDFFFYLTLLLFLVLRTVRLARSRATLAAERLAARQTQQLLLARSTQPTPGFTVESVYLPASEVGGDFFLVSPAPDNSLIVIVGDVSGKGLTAAMRVSMILGILRRETSRAPATILANLNDALITPGAAHAELGFTTACCLHLAPAGTFTLANAGHIAPYLAGPAASQELPTPPALPLGLASAQTYDTVAGTLTPAHTLILMSDGVPEARNPKGTLYGFEALPALTRHPAAEIARTAQTFGQEDDITVLSIALASA